MRRYKGKCDVFFERAQNEEGRKGRAVQQKTSRKGGGLQPMQQELWMKRQAVRTEIIHQEAYLWQSTAIFGAVMEAAEGALESILGNEGRIAQACTSGIQKVGLRGMKLCWKQS